ncbi:MAG: hypothetical protein JWL59_1622 [Chthoniobacteraceae bacterium]|nr:hypothetical protein [Chthoniobacteraceae bacterium]
MRGFVFSVETLDALLAERSTRSLVAQGITPDATVIIGAKNLAIALLDANEPLLLLQCGSWLQDKVPRTIPRSSTGLPLVACGGSRASQPPRKQAVSVDTTPRSLYLEPRAAQLLGKLLESAPWTESLHSLFASKQVRSVRLPELASCHDSALRILQVVTTIQIGGAEKIALDLADELNQNGHRAWIAALAPSTRKAYPPPEGFYDLSTAARDPQARAAAVAKLARHLHADMIHGHLISGAESKALHSHGIPLVVSVHNMPKAWPAGFGNSEKKADLLIACSQTVAREVEETESGTPCRTAWNGINAGPYKPVSGRLEESRQWRLKQGWKETDFVVISVANPRKQKQLNRIPEIIAKLQARLPTARCILAGESAPTSADGQEATTALDKAIAEWGMESSIVQVGGSDRIGALLGASDAYLSTSDFEGLSLAQLEALAAGLPIVITDTGGAGEIAAELSNDAAYCQRLPLSASADEFADALLRLPKAERVCRLPKAFQKEKMALRIAQLYWMTLAFRQRRNPEGIWIITNNFSMGGAQSSARRLLTRLHHMGIKVKAFTIEETAPTQGSRQLEAAGIPVVHVGAPTRLNPSKAVTRILSEAVFDPPEAVLFWNLIASCKVLLADTLEGVRLFDVSPGEMYFRSLAHYFEQPRPELPYRTTAGYGARLTGVVVKFAAEKPLAEAQLGAPCTIIRNGVDLHAGQKKPRIGKLIFGTAARISPDKRLEDLLAAFFIANEQLPPYELHIAGRIESGAADYARHLKDIGLNLPIVWRGELPGTDGFLNELDLFVMVSEPAGCPNASLEAMAAGLPVIATAVGGASEQVIDRVTGRLTPRRDNQALAQAIVELAHDQHAREQYGLAARLRVSAQFSLEAMANSYAALCLNRNRKDDAALLSQT